MTIQENLKVDSDSKELPLNQMIGRRVFLKWGIMGGLLLCPLCVIVFRKCHENIATTKLIYPGPFKKGEITPEIRQLGGNQWVRSFDIAQWKGTNRSLFVPNSLYMTYEQGCYNVYANFEYIAAIKDSFFTEYKININSHGKEYASNSGIWKIDSDYAKESTVKTKTLEHIHSTWENVWNHKSSIKIVKADISFEAGEEFLDEISCISLILK